jgi:hypothetical protein
MKTLTDIINENDYDQIDEGTIDPSMGALIVGQFMLVSTLVMGLIKNIGQNDGNSCIEEIKYWWNNKKANKIIKRLAKDEEIKQFLSDYKNNKGWRDLLRKKLSDKELEYLTSITKSKVRAKINN